jgi:hypothetical protein
MVGVGMVGLQAIAFKTRCACRRTGAFDGEEDDE